MRAFGLDGEENDVNVIIYINVIMIRDERIT